MRKIILFILLCGGLSFYDAALAISVSYHITGVKKEIREAILQRLQAPLAQLPKHAPQQQIDAIVAQNPERIRTALQPFGYFQPKIRTRREQQKIHYHITPRSVVRLTDINIQLTGPGAGDAQLKKIIKRLPLKRGEHFNVKTYQKSVQQLLTAALQRGYLDVHFTKREIAINRLTHRSRMTLILETGPIYYFGPVTFMRSPFATTFLQRYVPFKPGERYNSAALLKLQERLNNSGYFEAISVAPQMKQIKNQHIPIIVKLTPRKAHAYMLGVGYGTDTGGRARAGWQWRYLNPYGHHTNIDLQWSQKESYLTAQYTIPGEDPTSDAYILSLTQETSDTDSGESLTRKARAADRRRWGKWLRTVALDVHYEKFTKKDSEERTTTLLIPNLHLSRLHADDPLNPTHGNRIDIFIQGALRDVLSPLSFLQIRVDDKYLRTLSPNQRILLRGSVGYSIVEEFKRLPLSLNFTTGGSQTVRGYSYESLGPGRHLLVGSAEYQYRLSGPWYGAFFYDMGNAMDDFDLSDLQKAWGVGVLRQTGFGPVQASIAFPLDDEDRTWRLVFNIGPQLS